MAKCPDVDFQDESIAWTHCPSFPAAVLFAAIFFILTFVHFVQMFTFRKKFCWVLVMGGAWETAGFALRAASSQMMENEGLFIGHRNFIVLAPLWLNAFIYMVLARMIYFYVPEKACLRITARRLSLMFVTLDIVAFIVQASATGLMVSDDPKTADTGTHVYMGGIGLQECFILAFTYLSYRFQQRMKEVEATDTPVAQGSISWRTLLYVEYAGLATISIRIIYRLIEFSQGWEGDIAKSEEAFYVLDVVTMVVLMLLFNIYHPGRALVGPDSEFPKKEKKRKRSKRSRRSRKSERDESSDEAQELTTHV